MKKCFFLCGLLLLLICFGCETLETQRDRQLGWADADYRNAINKSEAERDLKLYVVRQPPTFPTSGTPFLLLYALSERDIRLDYIRLNLSSSMHRPYIFGLLSSLNDLPQTGQIDVDKAKNEIYNKYYYEKNLAEAQHQSNIQTIQNNYVNGKLQEIQTMNVINAINQSMNNLNQQIQYNNMINQQQNLQNQMYQLQNQR